MNNLTSHIHFLKMYLHVKLKKPVSYETVDDDEMKTIQRHFSTMYL